MRYLRVTDEDALLAALSEPSAAILCGGTDLIVRMRSGLSSPKLLVDVSTVPSLLGIHATGEAIEIGAAVPEAEILASPRIQEQLPLLVTALRSLGSVQIRSRGSLAGNLVNASPAADSIVPLLLYNTELELVGPDSVRILPVAEFLVGPGKTALGPMEFVRTIRIPRPTDGYHGFYHKVGRRRALTIAIASLGSLVQIHNGIVKEARFAAGSVAPTPVRLGAVETYLEGRALVPETFAEAGRLAMDAVSPISDVRASETYRREVIGDLVIRALRSIHREAA